MPESTSDASDPLTPPEPGQARREREFAALCRIHERYAATETARARLLNPGMPSPQEAVRLVTYLAGGAIPYESAEPHVQSADLVAALSLVPRVRAEVEELEIALLSMARGEGMTWSQIAFGLGMGSGQAAQQRYERLQKRAAPETDQ